jgi:hypothetical protein
MTGRTNTTSKKAQFRRTFEISAAIAMAFVAAYWFFSVAPM